VRTHRPGLLVAHGTKRPTAALAVGLAAACYWTAQAVTREQPQHLPQAVAEAFDRLSSFGLVTTSNCGWWAALGERTDLGERTRST